MSDTKLSQITWQGFAAYRLENSLIALIVVPSLGAKIASLIYKTSRRQWLWSNPYLLAKQPKHGDSYTAEFDLGGWDECFPSVAKTTYPESPWKGSEIADHGEIWSQEWHTETIRQNGTVALKMVARGVNIPYRFERTISISDNKAKLTLNYSVENLSNHAMPFIWCAHPTFAVKPGMQLTFPPQEMTVFSSIDDRFGKLGNQQSWPEIAEIEVGEKAEAANVKKFNLSQLPDLNAGFALKLCGPAPACGAVRLDDPETGDKLLFSFDPTQITHLGLWLNFNGWSGLSEDKTYYNLAIEPGIGAQDDLSLAYNSLSQYGQVPAHETVSWSLNVTLAGANMRESSEYEAEMYSESEVNEDGRLLTYYHSQPNLLDI